MPTPTSTPASVTASVTAPVTAPVTASPAIAPPPHVARLYRALQVYAAIALQVVYVTTVYGLSHHLGVEAWPLSARLFALPAGYLLEEALRLAITASVVAQSVYAWRLATRAGDRIALATGWVGLGALATLATIDALHDALTLLH